MKKARIFQIYYDEASRSMLDEGFIPLDNSNNPEQDWYEFSAIRNFLKSNELEQDTFYGFLSPKFEKKTGLNSASLQTQLDQAPEDSDVILVSSKLPSLVSYRNVFLQGEAKHPGLIAVMQKFCAAAGLEVDLAHMVNHTGNAVYSNFVIAKPVYWREWLKLADMLYMASTTGTGSLAQALNRDTVHRKRRVAMKVFVQERLPTLVLRGQMKIFVPEHFRRFDQFGSAERLLFRFSDFLKAKYEETGGSLYIKAFEYIMKPGFAAEEKLRETGKKLRKHPRPNS